MKNNSLLKLQSLIYICKTKIEWICSTLRAEARSRFRPFCIMTWTRMSSSWQTWARYLPFQSSLPTRSGAMCESEMLHCNLYILCWTDCIECRRQHKQPAYKIRLLVFSTISLTFFERQRQSYQSWFLQGDAVAKLFRHMLSYEWTGSSIALLIRSYKLMA